MSWTCRLVDREAMRERGEEPQIGDMWFDAHLLRSPDLSDWYRSGASGDRLPLVVMFPGGIWFCVDNAPPASRDGWRVTGDPPTITMTPSVRFYGGYHGFLQNGIISDDCEGRTF